MPRWNSDDSQDEDEDDGGWDGTGGLDEEYDDPENYVGDDDEFGPYEQNEFVSCPNCAGDVYEEAQQCPHCGGYIVQHERAWERRPWLWRALGLAGILALIWALARPF